MANGGWRRVDERTETVSANLFSRALAQENLPANVSCEPCDSFLHQPPFAINHFLTLIFRSIFAMFPANNLNGLMK